MQVVPVRYYKVRTFSEERGGAYRIHVFDTNITDTSKSLRNVRSIGTGSSEYYNIDYSNNTTLRETAKKPLLFDSPIQTKELHKYFFVRFT